MIKTTDRSLSREGEIVLEYSDAGFVSGKECILQDFKTGLITGTGSLFYDPDFGSGLLRHIHASSDEGTLLE